MYPIDLEYTKALKLMFPDTGSIHLVLVGCGGTGSWLAPAVARVGKVLTDRFNREVKIIFVDPDRVEEKNIYRQNFCAAEIGCSKAEALAERYGLAWEVEILGYADRFENICIQSHYGNQIIYIGCVDTPQARKEISKDVSRSTFTTWLDCGNTKNYGQVLLGTGYGVDPFSFKGFCASLPFPNEQHPELITWDKKEKKEKNPKPDLSCAEMALLDSQGLAINQRMAAEAADYLVQMLITKDLKKYATYIDLESGTSQSKYITEDAIRQFLKK